MKFKINDTECEVPTQLSELTLGQFIGFWNAHGRAFDLRMQEIVKNKDMDDAQRTIDSLELEIDEAVAWYSFFTGFDFSSIKREQSAELLINYRIIRDLLLLSEEQTKWMRDTFIWQDQVWVLKSWKVTPQSTFTFNELITSKEITRQIHSIGQGRWEALPYLCAVFLRLKDEAYSDSMVADGSERLLMMQDLPMDIAMHVAFFLNSSVSICRVISASLKAAETTLV